MSSKYKNLQISHLLNIVRRRKRWGLRYELRLKKRGDEKAQHKYLVGWLESSDKNNRLIERFKKRFVQGGLCNGR